MKACVSCLISTPRCAVLFFTAMAAAALGAALISQYAFGLQPCELCHYQRAPFAFVIVLGLIALFLMPKKPGIAKPALALISLAFFIDAVIAFYHTGVERKWWKSFLEGCTVPDMKGNITDVLAKIAATPAARCDEIPWTDPVIGLSMANYNVLLCLTLGALAACALCRAMRPSS